MRYGSVILSGISIAIAFLIIISLIIPFGVIRWSLHVLTIFLVFLFLTIRSNIKKEPDPEDEPWDL